MWYQQVLATDVVAAGVGCRCGGSSHVHICYKSGVCRLTPCVLTALAGTIVMMESQIEVVWGNIAALKNTKLPQEKWDWAPAAPSSKATSKLSKAMAKKNNKKPISDNDMLMFEQKKDLSVSIGKLEVGWCGAGKSH